MAKPSREASQDAQELRLELVVTPQLAQSTRATRALLACCHEARHYLRDPPDSLPLQGGGILRCNLEKDVIVLEGLSPSLLLHLRGLKCRNPNLLDNLASIRHIGLDLASASASEGFLSPETETDTGVGADEDPAIPPQLECAMVAFAASLPRLRHIYLLPPTAAAAAIVGSEESIPPSQAATDHTARCFFLGNDPATEWYTTRPLPSYWVDRAYYAQLSRLMRLLCGLREALGAPSVGTELPLLDEADVDRLRRVGLRILQHYAAVLRPGGVANCEGGDGGTEEEEEEEEKEVGGLLPSSPERCLEVALGRSPRWVQWEWVCQCLGC
ncbi:hypothetical protein MFIFM68171_00943 [Madurella fahalii]|uniref:Uncharacterized protein n=1 Tax=Madurella fahalii TaxID=1157608 RepID=A0ABQ0FZ24_9PEZI